MFKITGREKAVIGGLAAGVATLVVQLQNTGQLTTKEGLYAIGSWLFTHVVIYAVTNTVKLPIVPPQV